MILDVVEYESAARDGKTLKKLEQECAGVQPRKSDGFMCLSIKARDASKQQHLEVGRVVALTYAGKRYVLQTPASPFAPRAAEISAILSSLIS